MKAFKFCSWDGDPAVWAPGEAWVLRKGTWLPANSSEVGMEARVLSKAAFDAAFGSLPPLPKSQASPPRPTMAEIARDPACLDRWREEYSEHCRWVREALAPLREAERLRSEGKQTWPPLSDYERDDMDSEGQIATLDRLIEKQKKGHEKLVGLIHARSQQLAARQPRLVVDNTK